MALFANGSGGKDGSDPGRSASGRASAPQGPGTTAAGRGGAATPPQAATGPAGSPPAAGSPAVSGKILEELARLANTLESVRKDRQQQEARLGRLEQSVTDLVALSEAVTAQFNPFADPRAPSRPAAVKEPAPAAAPEAPTRSVPVGDGIAAMPDHAGSGFRNDVLVMDWASFLVEHLGTDGATSAAGRYRALGWVREDRFRDLTRAITQTSDKAAAAPWSRIDVDWMSRAYAVILGRVEEAAPSDRAGNGAPAIAASARPRPGNGRAMDLAS